MEIKTLVDKIGKSNKKDYDPTTILLNKFLKKITKLRVEGKFDDKIV